MSLLNHNGSYGSLRTLYVRSSVNANLKTDFNSISRQANAGEGRCSLRRAFSLLPASPHLGFLLFSNSTSTIFSCLNIFRLPWKLERPFHSGLSTENVIWYRFILKGKVPMNCHMQINSLMPFFMFAWKETPSCQ